MMPIMVQAAGPDPVRRALLLAGLAALPALAGCDVRLEDDAPRIPLVPTRSPLTEEARLTALTRACADLADLAADTPGAVAAALVPVHRRQHTVLRTTLARLGVPLTVIDTAPSPTRSGSSASPSPSPATSASARAAVAALAAEEGTAAAGAARFAEVDADLRPSIATLHAQRFAAARLLSGAPPAVPRDPVSDPLVAELASRTDGAAYLLEVVAARSEGTRRTKARSTLAVLQDLYDDQVAGGSRPQDEPLGHPLPFPVRTAADADRLARTALGALRAGYGPRVGPLLESVGAPGWSAVTRWLGAVEAECHRWGLPLEPFPSLT